MIQQKEDARVENNHSHPMLMIVMLMQEFMRMILRAEWEILAE